MAKPIFEPINNRRQNDQSFAKFLERIGLESDTNQNLTHRILLLTESKSVLSNSTYDNVIGHVLTRYCADYLPPQREAGGPAKVPRHLVNDLVRFWRTMAVDYGAKRWRTSKDDTSLRLIKLRTTRKILFAGPLCSLLLLPDRIKHASELSTYLRLWLSKPPLAQLASIASDDVIKLTATSMGALKGILTAYDRLLAILSERGTRKAFTDPDKAGRPTVQKCSDIADEIERGLEL